MSTNNKKLINAHMHGVEQDIADNARAIVECKKKFEHAKTSGIPSVGLFKEFFQLIRERADLMRQRASVFEMAIEQGVKLETHVDDGLNKDERLQRNLDWLCAN